MPIECGFSRCIMAKELHTLCFLNRTLDQPQIWCSVIKNLYGEFSPDPVTYSSSIDTVIPLQGDDDENQTQRKNYRGTRVYRRRVDGQQQGEPRQGRVSQHYRK